MDGKDPAESTLLFSTRGFTATRNPDCWAAGYDLTWLSEHSQGILLTREIPFVLFANHRTPPTIQRFVGASNERVQRSVLAAGEHRIGTTDLAIYRLDGGAIPPSISVAEIIPADWVDHLLHIKKFPFVYLEEEYKALVGQPTNWQGNGFWAHWPDSVASFDAALHAPWMDFIEKPLTGSSGKFIGAPVSSTKIGVIAMWYNPHYGSVIRPHIDAINAKIIELGGTEEVTIADLSGFNNYS